MGNVLAWATSCPSWSIGGAKNHAVIDFTINGERVGPAFVVLVHHLQPELFFAVCGTPGFAIDLLEHQEATEKMIASKEGVPCDRLFVFLHGKRLRGSQFLLGPWWLGCS